MAKSKTDGSASEESPSRRVASPTPFGVYQDPGNGVWWLLQGGEPVSAAGLPPSFCPFVRRSFAGPHSFDLEAPEPAQAFRAGIEGRLGRNPLVRRFLPVVGAGRELLVLGCPMTAMYLLGLLHSLSCPAPMLVVNGYDPEGLGKVTGSFLSNLSHVLVLGVSDACIPKLMRELWGVMSTGLKVTLVTSQTDPLILPGLGRNVVYGGLDREVLEFLKEWELCPEQFRYYGSHLVRKRMLEDYEYGQQWEDQGFEKLLLPWGNNLLLTHRGINGKT